MEEYKMNKSIIIISLLFVIGLIVQNKIYSLSNKALENRYNNDISKQATSVALMVQYENNTITREVTINYTNKIEPTYTPQPTYTPIPVTVEIQQLPQTTQSPLSLEAPRLTVPVQKYQPERLYASDVVSTPLTLDETWTSIKTMLNDLGLWQPTQIIFIILFVIIAVMTFLSYFKA
jgi:hypothetical protein